MPSKSIGVSNKFDFFIGHRALLYLVNKPCNIGRIVQWFLILLEFDFTMVVKKGITYQREDHLSRLINGENLVGIPDDLLEAYLLNVEMVPKWNKDVVPMLIIGNLHLSTLAFIEQSQHYSMVVGRLYWKEDRDPLI